ncbi:MAG: hypothetical protein QM648_11010 [Solirubrobacterales bacterium]
MLKKISIASAALLTVLLVGASQVGAQTVAWEVSVKPTYGYAGECLVSPTKARVRIAFGAEVQAVGIDPPSKVRIAYQVYDRGNKWTVASRAINLYASANYTKESRSFIMTKGRKYSMRLKSSYQVTGHKLKRSDKLKLESLTDAEWAMMPNC